MNGRGEKQLSLYFIDEFIEIEFGEKQRGNLIENVSSGRMD